MSLAPYYRQLGLRTGASYQDVKLAFRQLARIYHPDMNPGDLEAKEKFIAITQAYRLLAARLVPAPVPDSASVPDLSRPAAAPISPPLTQEQPPLDHALKRQFFGQLRLYLQQGRFPRAVALVEGLRQQLPTDAEVGQWYATTYYRWGHSLLEQGQTTKARACLKKAQRTDPLNRSLQQAIRQDWEQLERLAGKGDERPARAC